VLQADLLQVVQQDLIVLLEQIPQLTLGWLQEVVVVAVLMQDLVQEQLADRGEAGHLVQEEHREAQLTNLPRILDNRLLLIMETTEVRIILRLRAMPQQVVAAPEPLELVFQEI
jgi:hypothetical protein